MENTNPVNESSEEMEFSQIDNDAFQCQSKESEGNPTTLGNQVLPLDPKGVSKNQQLPAVTSAETCTPTTVPTSASFSQTSDIHQIDDAFLTTDTFVSSRNLRIRTNCSRLVDAVVSPRQNPTLFSVPVLDQPDANSANDRSDRLPLGASRNPEPSGVKLPGEKNGGANASDGRDSEYVSIAQKLLLTVLQEMMESEGDSTLWIEFKKSFLKISKVPAEQEGFFLESELFYFLINRKSALEIDDSFQSHGAKSEYHTKRAYELLVNLAVTALASTVTVWSSLDFDAIIRNYRSFRTVYDKCSLFWKEIKVEDAQKETSRNRPEIRKEKIQKLLLQTKNALQMLLIHVGEHVGQEKLDKYEEELAEEDKKYLRRKIY